MSSVAIPQIQVSTRSDGVRQVALSGSWTLVMLKASLRDLSASLVLYAADSQVSWDCQAIETMDSAGAILLWRCWQRKLPPALLARPEHLRIFERVGSVDYDLKLPPEPGMWQSAVLSLGYSSFSFVAHMRDFMTLLGVIVLDLLHLLRRPGEIPYHEISANLFKSGVRAMPVTAMVGFLIGIVLSYLSALQLKQLGGEVYIVNILGMGVIRELGPVLVAVLVAGRSGSAMTAQLGVMRVTEEIDALATMGVSRSLRLILPKVVALGIAMPLLVLWTNAIALVGGMISAQIQLDISYAFFFETLPKVVPVANLWIGLVKGIIFGVMVALVACHYGLRVLPNTESLSANTTSSVVTSITVVILIDAIVAIVTRNIGLIA